MVNNGFSLNSLADCVDAAPAWLMPGAGIGRITQLTFLDCVVPRSRSSCMAIEDFSVFLLTRLLQLLVIGEYHKKVGQVLTRPLTL